MVGNMSAPLGEPFDLPAFAVGLLHVVVGFGDVGEAELGGVPGELLAGEAAGDGAEQARLGPQAGVIEMGCGFPFAADGVGPLPVMVDFFQLGNLVVGKFFLGQKLGKTAVPAQEDAIFAYEEAAVVGEFFAWGQRG